MGSLQKLAKRTFIFLNVIVAFLFLLSCCNAFLHPDKWWWVALLAFFFPLFLLLLLLFFIFWLVLRSRVVLISLVCLLIGWKNIHAFFGFNPSGRDFSRKDSTGMRVITWNVRQWDEFITKKTGASGHRQLMLDLLKKQNPDILCLQEFYEPADSSQSNIRYIARELNLPNYYFSRDFHSRNRKYETGSIIFTHYPMGPGHKTLFYPDSAQRTQNIISADLNVDGKIFRIYTTHLQSVLFKPRDFRNVEIIQNAEDSMLEASRSLAKKLKSALGLRGHQADIVRKTLDTCSFPLIVCGDFNDVPNSYTYFHIRGKLQDAFIAKSLGIGRTYTHISPTLRIDYILPSDDFRVLQSMKLNAPYSDHHMVMADLQLEDK